MYQVAIFDRATGERVAYLSEQENVTTNAIFDDYPSDKYALVASPACTFPLQRWASPCKISVGDLVRVHGVHIELDDTLNPVTVGRMGRVVAIAGKADDPSMGPLVFVDFGFDLAAEFDGRQWWMDAEADLPSTQSAIFADELDIVCPNFYERRS
jgi:hypothetical protein